MSVLLDATEDRAVTAGLLAWHRDQDRYPEDSLHRYLDAAATYDEAR